jgi:hypothetical protein
MTQRNVLPIAPVPCGGYNRRIELPNLETFPGESPAYQPIELRCYPAAARQLPSRRLVHSTRSLTLVVRDGQASE